jgi:hypothetical protein
MSKRLASTALVHDDIKGNIKYSEMTKQFIDKNIGNNILIIGVVPGEEKFHERFGELIGSRNVIFSDVAELDTANYPFIKMNSNSMEELEEMASTFPGKFNTIISDGVGTTKFLQQYTDKHISILLGAISKNGMLILHDSIHLGFYNDTVLYPVAKNAIYISKEMFMSANKTIPQLFNGKIFLDNLYIPISLVQDIKINSDKLEKLESELLTIASLLNSDSKMLIKAANQIVELGLQPSDVIHQRKIKTEAISEKISISLQKQEFLNTGKSEFIQRIKDSILQKFTSYNINKVEVKDLYCEDNLFMPKDHKNSLSEIYIKYEIHQDQENSIALAGEDTAIQN